MRAREGMSLALAADYLIIPTWRVMHIVPIDSKSGCLEMLVSDPCCVKPPAGLRSGAVKQSRVWICEAVYCELWGGAKGRHSLPYRLHKETSPWRPGLFLETRDTSVSARLFLQLLLTSSDMFQCARFCSCL